MRALSVIRGSLGFILFLLLVAPIAAQPATPAPAGAGTPLAELMRLMPDSVSPDVSYAYADYAQQLAARGHAGDASEMAPDELLLPVVTGLPQPRVFIQPDPAWREAFGFDLRDVDQFLDVNTGDRTIAIFRGAFDPAALHAAWEASDYAPVEFEGVTYHSAGEDYFIDFEHPAHSLHVGAFSYLAALDDRTIVATALQAEMEEVIRVHAGEHSSLAEGLAAPLLAAPADVVGARIVHGGMLQFQVDPLMLMPLNPNVSPETQERLATQVAELQADAPRMPPIAMALIGYTAGDLSVEAETSTSVAVAVVAPLNPTAAELVAEVAADRFVTMAIMGLEAYQGRPFTELFSDSSFEIVAGGEAVVVRLTPTPEGSPLLLMTLLNSGNPTLFYW